VKIQVAGPGCKKCHDTERNVRDACEQLNVNAEILHVSDIKDITKLGVLFTPAVIVNGKIVFSGKLPSVEDLKNYFSKLSR